MSRKTWATILFAAVAAVLLWAYTEVEAGQGCYGCLIKLESQDAARWFGVERPGQYIGDHRSRLVHPLRGGIRMVLGGTFAADMTRVKVGFRGLWAGLTRTREGYLAWGLLAAGLGLALWSLRRHKKKALPNGNAVSSS